jgi:hypothetical protein
MTVENERLLPHVKLNDGEIGCPHCRTDLVMNCATDTIFLERQCPSCQRAFIIVNNGVDD